MTTCRSDTGPPPRRHRGVSDPPLLLPIAAATMWEIRPSTLRNNPGNRPRIYMGYNSPQPPQRLTIRIRCHATQRQLQSEATAEVIDGAPPARFIGAPGKLLAAVLIYQGGQRHVPHVRVCRPPPMQKLRYRGVPLSCSGGAHHTTTTVQPDLRHLQQPRRQPRLMQRHCVRQPAPQQVLLALHVSGRVMPLVQVVPVAVDRRAQRHSFTPATSGLNSFHSRRNSLGVSFK